MKRIYQLICLSALTISVVGCSKDNNVNFVDGYDLGSKEDTLNIQLDTNRNFINKSKYTQARVFPGLVGDAEVRVKDFPVTVDLNYIAVPSSDLRISVTPGAWQSTAMYAPAGELVEIVVPEGVYGLTALVGAHVNKSEDGIPVPQRDLDITIQKVLFPGKNFVRNLYGGLVYILPSAPLGRTVELKFTGAVKAPSFKLGVTDPAQWKEEIKKSTVPWFELEGNRIVFTLQTQKAKTIGVDDPKELMETWDKAIKVAYWDWTGLTEGNPNPKHRAPFNKWRIVHDVLFKSGVAQVSGYPVRARANDSYFKQATTIEEVKYLNWGTYHELGHNMQQNSIWNISTYTGEVSNNLFHFRVSKVFGKQSYKIAEIWNKGIAQKFIGSGVKWNTTFADHLDIRLIFYAQIFERYGYEFMTYLYTRARNARFLSANDQSKNDFFYEAVCEYTKIDMLPFFDKWGWTISDVSRKYVEEQLGYPKLTEQVWLASPVRVY